MDKKIKNIAIIGGGTSALFLAAFLDTSLFDICIYEKKKSLGRKFLVAGDGGFNLTHSEHLDQLKTRYYPTGFLDEALESFDNVALRNWLSDISIPSFVGSSGRVFPKQGIKPIEVLIAIKSYLVKKNIQFNFNKTFTGWTEGMDLIFNDDKIIKADYSIFALGGSSWKVTGSDGSWLDLFHNKGIKTVPFKAVNCAYKINWPQDFINRHEGTPLKNIVISSNDSSQKGEAVITKFGIEGNAIYGLSLDIQNQLDQHNEATIFVDFKPTLSLATVSNKIKDSNSNITTTLKEKLKLPKAIIDLIKMTLSKETFLNIELLSASIKQFPLKLINFAPIDEAISTTGGIDINAINSKFELNKIKRNYCIGEMLDWYAPTGGYLIQGCASIGVYLANHLNNIYNA